MTETPSSLLDLGRRLWVIRVDFPDGDGKIGKVLGKISKHKTHEGLQKASVNR